MLKNVYIGSPENVNFRSFTNSKINLHSCGPNFFSDLNYAGISLEACKENASRYQFSEIANFSDRIVLECLKEIQAIYYQDRRTANIDSNILRI